MSGRSSGHSLDEVLTLPRPKSTPMQNGDLNERAEKAVRGLRSAKYLQDGADSSMHSDSVSPAASRPGDASNQNSSPTSSWRTAESGTKRMPPLLGMTETMPEHLLLKGPFHQRLELLGIRLSSEKETIFFSFYAEFQDALQELLTAEELHQHNTFMRDLQSRILHGADVDLPPLPDIHELARSSGHHHQSLLQLKPFSSKEAEQLVRAEQSARNSARRPAKRQRSGTAAAAAAALDVSAAANAQERQTGGRVRTRSSAVADRRSRLARDTRPGPTAVGMLFGDSARAGTVSAASYRDEAIFQQATADLRQRELLRRSERLDMPAVANAMTLAMAKQRGAPLRRASPAAGTHAGYPALPFSPLPPGLSLDLEIFLKLKRRLVHLLEAVEQMSTNATGNEVWAGYESLPLGFSSTAKASSRSAVTGIRDEAVALLVHSIEMQVRDLLDVIYGLPDDRGEQMGLVGAQRPRLPV
ncbi:hypothetical protein F1559_000100 [Cyanidiococcus yangmingshanensis]|uniref:Uncharacterized protein n=1 Tax=Cyanidiococcus yangmingshanensis TaxID=2690220 RepID=A0A7J7IKS2_9RHOD|nr:hypothetical protein F1559_000100 [Cyanidiococcus yangmingshanensis]